MKWLLTLALLAIFSARAQAQLPSPQQVALTELRSMQLRAPALWRQRDHLCMGCGAAAVAVGIPVAALMVPVGGLLMALASYGDDHWERRDRRVGGVVMTFGFLGAAAIAWGAWKIHKTRRARHAIDRELRGISERRGVLEQFLENFALGPRAPAFVDEP